MHTLTIFNKTDHETLIHYNSASPDKYLSDFNNYSDSESDLGSDDYNNYDSNYESDNKEAPCASTSIAKTLLV